MPEGTNVSPKSAGNQYTCPLPASIASVEQLEECLSTPQVGLVEDLASLPGDLIVLGVAGKVGPTLARMAKRAAPEKRVIGVARFSDPDLKARLASWGVETLACDLLDRRQVEQLPRLPNVIYMAGRKFGTAGQEPLTWAMNAVAPMHVAEHFRASRIVAFSTLCVYPFAPVDGPGCDESVAPTPFGEYANSCVARERIFQHFSAQYATPGRLIRLNYAVETRYGVLHDIGVHVRDGTPLDLSTPCANVIWQGDANNQILRSLLHVQTPAAPLNIGAPRATRVRDVAEALGRFFGRKPVFAGAEQPTAWVTNCAAANGLFGDPVVSLEQMIGWNAEWLLRQKPVHGKPTRFHERGGEF